MWAWRTFGRAGQGRAGRSWEMCQIIRGRERWIDYVRRCGGGWDGTGKCERKASGQRGKGSWVWGWHECSWLVGIESDSIGGRDFEGEEDV